MTLESIAWRGVHVEIPDTDRTVLVYGPKLAFEELRATVPRHVWMGWRDPESGQWYAVDAAELAGVTDWAELPTGAE